MFSSPCIHSSPRQLYCSTLGGNVHCLDPVSKVPSSLERKRHINSIQFNISIECLSFKAYKSTSLI